MILQRDPKLPFKKIRDKKNRPRFPPARTPSLSCKQRCLRTSGWGEVYYKYRPRVPFGTRFFSRAIWGLSEDSGPSESETAHFDHRNQHLEVLVPGRQLVAEMWDY